MRSHFWWSLRRSGFCRLFVIGAVLGASGGAALAPENVLDHVVLQHDPAIALAQDIWEFAELGYLENRSTERREFA